QIGISAHALICGAVRLRLCNERMREGLVGCHADLGIDGEAAFDEVASGEGDTAPVFDGGEGVVGD
ncbi:MAG: hypothetical protein Q9194_006196, partial [Teloschistes cf. exilis]